MAGRPLRRVVWSVSAAVTAVGLVAAVAACGSDAVPLAPSRAGTPAAGAAGPTSGEHLLTSDGRLYSEQTDAGACFWFVAGTGVVYSLTWPDGYTAQAGPLRVLDRSGREVARTFQEGLGFTGHLEPGRTGCAPGGLSRSFVVASVAQVGVGSPDDAR